MPELSLKFLLIILACTGMKISFTSVQKLYKNSIDVNILDLLPKIHRIVRGFLQALLGKMGNVCTELSTKHAVLGKGKFGRHKEKAN